VTVLIVGHRGAKDHRPENSLASFALAEQIGVDEIEMDVRVSRDGHLFILHDDTLDRTAGEDAGRGRGPVAAQTLEQLQRVRLDSGRGVVTVAEMYDATRTPIQLEVKDEAALPALALFFAERPADAARTILAAFSADTLSAAADALPTLRRQIILTELADAEAFAGGLDGLLGYTRASRVACGFAGLTGARVAELQGGGLEVHVWPMTSMADMVAAVALGADGTTSGDPAQAIAWRDRALAERITR